MTELKRSPADIAQVYGFDLWEINLLISGIRVLRYIHESGSYRARKSNRDLGKLAENLNQAIDFLEPALLAQIIDGYDDDAKSFGKEIARNGIDLPAFLVSAIRLADLANDRPDTGSKPNPRWFKQANECIKSFWEEKGNVYDRSPHREKAKAFTRDIIGLIDPDYLGSVDETAGGPEG